MNADFRLDITIDNYENPGHRLESGRCCVQCCPFCCFLGCDDVCDNYFVIFVYDGACHDPGCELWGRFEYHYGQDDSMPPSTPLTIVGQRECPVQVCKSDFRHALCMCGGNC